MPFLILFQDNPNADPDIRTTHMPDHLAFLEANAAVIQAAGPLFDTAGTGQGGAWIVTTHTAQEATDLVHADPFWPTGLRASFKVLRWHQVFAGGTRRV